MSKTMMAAFPDQRNAATKTAQTEPRVMYLFFKTCHRLEMNGRVNAHANR